MKKILSYIFILAVMALGNVSACDLAWLSRPCDVPSFVDPDANMVPCLEKYLQEPEWCGDSASYDHFSSRIYGVMLSLQYPRQIISYESYKELVRGFSATYASAGMPPGKHIAKISVEPDSKIVFFGDLHGDIQALSRMLCKLLHEGFIDAQFRIIDPKNRIIFLGDFVDYGRYGADTFALAMKLRIQNPRQVFLCRGNHEDEITYHSHAGPSNNFGKELFHRYGSLGNKLGRRILGAFELLPLAIFIEFTAQPEKGFIQCCHGALGDDIETEIQTLLTTPGLSHVSLIAEDSSEVKGGRNLQWGDFTGLPLPEGDGAGVVEGRGGLFAIDGEKGVNGYFAKHNIKALMRGHQDLCSSYKNLVAGIKDPICLAPHRSSEKEALADARYATWLRVHVPTLEALNAKWFILQELPEFISPVFTFSNASSSKFNFDEGYGMFEVSESWELSRLRPYIFRPEIFKIRYEMFKGAENFALASVLLLPHYTYIDGDGNPTVYLEEPETFKKLFAKPAVSMARLRVGITEAMFNSFYSRFKKSDGVPRAGISPEFKARFGIVEGGMPWLPIEVGHGGAGAFVTAGAGDLAAAVWSPIPGRFDPKAFATGDVNEAEEADDEEDDDFGGYGEFGDDFQDSYK
jgi:hypothetical protein